MIVFLLIKKGNILQELEFKRKGKAVIISLSVIFKWVILNKTRRWHTPCVLTLTQIFDHQSTTILLA